MGGNEMIPTKHTPWRIRGYLFMAAIFCGIAALSLAIEPNTRPAPTSASRGPENSHNGAIIQPVAKLWVGQPGRAYQFTIWPEMDSLTAMNVIQAYYQEELK